MAKTPRERAADYARLHGTSAVAPPPPSLFNPELEPLLSLNHDEAVRQFRTSYQYNAVDALDASDALFAFRHQRVLELVAQDPAAVDEMLETEAFLLTNLHDSLEQGANILWDTTKLAKHGDLIPVLEVHKTLQMDTPKTTVSLDNAFVSALAKKLRSVQSLTHLKTIVASAYALDRENSTHVLQEIDNRIGILRTMAPQRIEPATARRFRTIQTLPQHPVTALDLTDAQEFIDALEQLAQGAVGTTNAASATDGPTYVPVPAALLPLGKWLLDRPKDNGQQSPSSYVVSRKDLEGWKRLIALQPEKITFWTSAVHEQSKSSPRSRIFIACIFPLSANAPKHMHELIPGGKIALCEANYTRNATYGFNVDEADEWYKYASNFSPGEILDLQRSGIDIPQFAFRIHHSGTHEKRVLDFLQHGHDPRRAKRKRVAAVSSAAVAP